MTCNFSEIELKQQVRSTWEWILFPYAAQENVSGGRGTGKSRTLQ